MDRAVSCGDILDGCHPKIKSIIEYWLGIGPEGELPGRQHLDPIDLRKLLSDVWLVDVIGNPPRFKYRVVGTKIVEYLGQDPTRKWMDDVFPHLEETFTFRDLTLAVKEARPQWRRGTPTLQFNKDFKVVEQVSLPLANDGRNVNMVISLTLF